jgi:hypothetical protein
MHLCLAGSKSSHHLKLPSYHGALSFMATLPSERGPLIAVICHIVQDLESRPQNHGGATSLPVTRWWFDDNKGLQLASMATLDATCNRWASHDVHLTDILRPITASTLKLDI